MPEETEVQSRFSLPDAEMVAHAVRELEYDERLTVHKMNPASGNQSLDIYNLPNSLHLLFGTDWNQVSGDGGGRAGITWVDPDVLVAWVRDVIGDTELADAISQTFSEVESHKERMQAILPLFVERVAQYREVMGPVATEDESGSETE